MYFSVSIFKALYCILKRVIWLIEIKSVTKIPSLTSGPQMCYFYHFYNDLLLLGLAGAMLSQPKPTQLICFFSCHLYFSTPLPTTLRSTLKTFPIFAFSRPSALLDFFSAHIFPSHQLTIIQKYQLHWFHMSWIVYKGCGYFFSTETI